MKKLLLCAALLLSFQLSAFDPSPIRMEENDELIAYSLDVVHENHCFTQSAAYSKKNKTYHVLCTASDTESVESFCPAINPQEAFKELETLYQQQLKDLSATTQTTSTKSEENKTTIF